MKLLRTCLKVLWCVNAFLVAMPGSSLTPCYLSSASSLPLAHSSPSPGMHPDGPSSPVQTCRQHYHPNMDITDSPKARSSTGVSPSMPLEPHLCLTEGFVGCTPKLSPAQRSRIVRSNYQTHSKFLSFNYSLFFLCFGMSQNSEAVEFRQKLSKKL